MSPSTRNPQPPAGTGGITEPVLVRHHADGAGLGFVQADTRPVTRQERARRRVMQHARTRLAAATPSIVDEQHGDAGKGSA